MCSSWSAPVWMKTNESFKGGGSLKGVPGDKYHKTWAKYLVRFLDEYEKLGLDFEYMTTQNEPTNGYAIPAFWQSLGWSSTHMRDWVKMDLGPEMGNRLEKTKLLMLDDIR